MARPNCVIVYLCICLYLELLILKLFGCGSFGLGDTTKLVVSTPFSHRKVTAYFWILDVEHRFLRAQKFK